MHGWEQLPRVWLRTKHTPPSVAAHRWGPRLGGACRVFGEPSGHAGWTALTARSDVATGSPPLNGRRAGRKTQACEIHFVLRNPWSSWTLPYRTTFPRWVQSSSNNSSRAVRAHSSLQALCSTLPNTTDLRANLNVPSSWGTGQWRHLTEGGNQGTSVEMCDDEGELSLTFRTRRVSRTAAHWEQCCARTAARWKSMKLSGWDRSWVAHKGPCIS